MCFRSRWLNESSSWRIYQQNLEQFQLYSLFYALDLFTFLETTEQILKKKIQWHAKYWPTMVNDLILLMLLRHREWLTVCFSQIILWFLRSMKQVTEFLLKCIVDNKSSFHDTAKRHEKKPPHKGNFNFQLFS